MAQHLSAIIPKLFIQFSFVYTKIRFRTPDLDARYLLLFLFFTKESIEVRNIYVYPEYEAGSLYNDITLLELGRRVLFDFQVKYIDINCSGEQNSFCLLNKWQIWDQNTEKKKINLINKFKQSILFKNKFKNICFRNLVTPQYVLIPD